MASVVAFLTPIGHHGNLLVYGPGGYEFADFVKAGTPLTVICAVVVVLLAPLIWQGQVKCKKRSLNRMYVSSAVNMMLDQSGRGD